MGWRFVSRLLCSGVDEQSKMNVGDVEHVVCLFTLEVDDGKRDEDGLVNLIGTPAYPVPTTIQISSSSIISMFHLISLIFYITKLCERSFLS